LEEKEFRKKFLGLFDLISKDYEKKEEFRKTKTLEESHRVACKFVGEIDFDLYKKAFKNISDLVFKSSELSDEHFSRVSGGKSYFADVPDSWASPDFLGTINGLLGPLSSSFSAGKKVGMALNNMFKSDEQDKIKSE
jgi:hypothetical protein